VAFALTLGAAAAVALFVIRLLLPMGAKYDRAVISLFRWLGLAGILTVAAVGAYALAVFR
jgi:hypothetical protein